MTVGLWFIIPEQIIRLHGFDGGIGISETLYSKIKLLWEKTLELIENCECKDGCPSCIYSPKCGNENQPLDKKAANITLKKLLQLASKKL